MSDKNGGPAFPFYFKDMITKRECEGMTLRQWFAGQALVGLLSSPLRKFKDADEAAQMSYELADACLKEREKE